jgi:hypothetical protein
MLTNTRDGRDFSVVFEDGYAFAGEADDAGTVRRDFGDGAGVQKLRFRVSRFGFRVGISQFVHASFLPRR